MECEGLTPTCESKTMSKLYDGFVMMYTKHRSLSKNQRWGEKKEVRNEDQLRDSWRDNGR